MMAISRTLLGGLVRGTTRGGISEEQARELSEKLERKGIKNPVNTGYLPQRGGLGNALKDLLKYSDDDIQPQGPLESIAQGVIGELPSYLLGRSGGSKESLARGLSRLTAGQTASQGLEAAGAPQFVQEIGKHLGEGDRNSCRK